MKENHFKIEESWSVLKGKNDGNEMLIRKNDWFTTIAGKKEYPFRAGIAFKILNPREDGFPDTNEM